MSSDHGTRLNLDILWYVCDIVRCDRDRVRGALRNISLTCRVLRGRVAPLLFQTIHMHRYWDADAFRALLELKCIHPHVRNFSFDRALSPAQERPRAARTPEQLSHGACLLSALLQSFTKPETLSFIPSSALSGRELKQVVETLLSSALKMPTVRLLDAHMDGLNLHQLCPNLNAVSTGIFRFRGAWPRSALITKLILAYFVVPPMEEESVFAELQECMPNIQTLVFDPRTSMYSSETIAAMRGFRRLETLALPDLAKLDDQYRALSDISCRTPEQQAQLGQARTFGLNRVKTVALWAFPRLKHMWVGVDIEFDFTSLGLRTADEIAKLEPLERPHGYRASHSQLSIAPFCTQSRRRYLQYV